MRNLIISNNNITSNQGNLAGGIGIGTPDVGFDSQNDNVIVRNNKVHANGGVDGSGGIAMNEGSENYLVEGNLVTGNFSRFNGGGIAHNGFSPGNNVIRKNQILFNEVFFGALLNTAGDGGGIFVGDTVAGVEGTGNVTIEANLIQGNLTGAGSGAGIRAFAVNAEDVLAAPANDCELVPAEHRQQHHRQQRGRRRRRRASRCRTCCAREHRQQHHRQQRQHGHGQPGLRTRARPTRRRNRPGSSSATHSAALQALHHAGRASRTSPTRCCLNNIIWHNRSFYNNASLNGGAGGLAPNPAGPYWDLARHQRRGHAADAQAGRLDPLFDFGVNGENYNAGLPPPCRTPRPPRRSSTATSMSSSRRPSSTKAATTSTCGSRRSSRRFRPPAITTFRHFVGREHGHQRCTEAQARAGTCGTSTTATNVVPTIDFDRNARTGTFDRGAHELGALPAVDLSITITMARRVPPRARR